jgi:glutamine synthetase
MHNISFGLLAKLTDRLKKDNRLEHLIDQLLSRHNLTPCFGVEIEFYCSPKLDINKLSELANIIISTEKGRNQFEVTLPPSIKILSYIEEINGLRKNLIASAIKLGGEATFQAKPFENDFGSSMHFHINFLEEQHGEMVEFDAKALCYHMLESFLVFMPNANDYQRIDKNFMTPVDVSYGNNNRTTAIRIPDAAPRRLEHRLASPLADPYLVIYTILKSILLGRNNKGIIEKAGFNKIYGNAYDSQYNLKALPSSITEALGLFNHDFFEVL